MDPMRANKARRLQGKHESILSCELSHRNAIRTMNDVNSSREATQHA
jgi:hypothetical protein